MTLDEIDMNKVKKIAIVLGAVLLVIIAILIFTRSRSPANQSFVQPQKIAALPTIPYEKGGGIDLSAPTVKKSVEQVNKIKTALPFKKEFTSSNGIEVEVFIPPAQYLENEWTLTIQIYGPVYEVPAGSKDYDIMKIAYREGVAEAYTFLASQSINPADVIIQWGDRAFIHNRAEEWLN